VRVIDAHEDDIDAASVSPDGRLIASAGHDRDLRVWNLATGQRVASMGGHTDEIEWVSWSPDGRRLATTSIDARVRIYDFERRALERSLPGRNRSVSRVRVRGGARRRRFAGDSPRARRSPRLDDVHPRRSREWSGPRRSACQRVARRRRPRSTTPAPRPSRRASPAGVTPVNWFADGRAGVGLETARRDPDARAEPPAGQRSRAGLLRGLVPGRRWIASASARRVSSYAADGDRRVSAAYTGPALHHVAPDGPLASAHAIARRQSGTARRCLRVPEGASAWDARFSLDGKRIASCSFDTTIRVYDVHGRAARPPARDTPARSPASTGLTAPGRHATGHADCGTWIAGPAVWSAREGARQRRAGPGNP
jgi:WD40 repeat protein